MFKSLLSVNLKWLAFSLFSNGNTKGGNKKSPLKKKATVALVVLLALYVTSSLMLSVCLLFSSISTTFGQTELDWFYFTLIGFTVFLFTFIGSVFSTQSIIFGSKDNELLLSMPVPTFYIIASRISVLFVLDLLYAFLLAIPAIGVYFYRFGFSFKTLLMYTVCVLMTVIFSAAITCFFAWPIALISSKIKHGALFQTLFSLLFLGAYMFAFSNLQNYINLIISNGAEIAQAFSKYLPVFYFFGTAVSASNLLSLAALAVSSLVLFVLACKLVSKNFIRIATSKKQGKKKVYTEKELTVTSAKQALLRKELSRFFTLPMYILNCGTGCLMMIIFSVFVLIRGQDMLYAFTAANETKSEALVPVVLCIIFGFCSGMCDSSAASISLEGSRINLIRSMPIKSDDFFYAKYMSNLIIGTPPLILSLILSSIGLKLTLAEAFSATAACFGVFAVSNFLNLFCNTLMPRFSWSSEIVVIKQSVSVIAGMLSTMFICALLYAPYFIFAEKISTAVYLWLVTAATAVISVIFINYFKNGGKKRFENMFI